MYPNPRQLAVAGVFFASIARALPSVEPIVHHQAEVTSVAFLADGEHAVSSSKDATIKVWDLKSGTLVRTLARTRPERLSGRTVDKLIALADGSVASADGLGNIALWNPERGELLKAFDRGGAGQEIENVRGSTCFAALADRWFVSGGFDGPTVLYDASSGAVQAFDGGCGAATFLPDQTLLVQSVAETPWEAVSIPSLKKVPVPLRVQADTFPAWQLFAVDPSLKFSVRPHGAGAARFGGEKVVQLESATGDLYPRALAVFPDAHVMSVTWDGRLLTWNARGALFDTRPLELGDAKRVSAAAISVLGDRVLYGCEDGSVRLWDVAGQAVRTRFLPTLPWLGEIVDSGDGARVVSLDQRGMTRVHDSATGAVLASVPGPTTAIAVDAKHQVLATVGTDGLVQTWTADSGTLRAQGMKSAGARRVAVSPNGEFVATLSDEGEISLWNPSSGGVRNARLEKGGEASALFFSPSGEWLVAGAKWSALRWNLPKNQLASLRPAWRYLGYAADGRELIQLNNDGLRRYEWWDPDKDDFGRGAPITIGVDAWGEGPAAPSLSADGRTALAIDQVGWAAVRHLEEKHRERTPADDPFRFGISALPVAVALSPDGRYAAVGGRDGAIRLVRLADRALVSWIGVGKEWVSWTADGFFDGSRRAGDLLQVTEGYRAFAVDQLAARYNRPDLLLERLGLGSSTLIEHYAARQRIRLRRLGLREDELGASYEQAPEVRSLSCSVEGDAVHVVADARARGDAKLLRRSLFVNGVSVGDREKPVFASDQREAKLDERISLSSGENRIEVSVTDSRGAESLRERCNAEGPARAPGDIYFVAFGVNAPAAGGAKLAYAEEDARALACIFESLPNGHALPLLGADATVYATGSKPSGVARAAAFLAQSKVNDTVVLFLAGHGAHTEDAAADYAFLTHDARPDALRESAWLQDDIDRLLQGAPARKRLLVFDACESGDLDRTERRGLAATRSFLRDRDHYIYNDLSRRSGAVVLSSSTGQEPSTELEALGHGVFSWYLQAALTSGDADTNGDSRLGVAELGQFVSSGVASRTNDHQHPVIDRDNPAVDIELPIARGAACATPPRTAGRLPPQQGGCACRATGGPSNASAGWALITLIAGAALIVRGRRSSRQGARL
ncbi:MAG: caspase family protein [Polyangiaceae bacterium]